MTRQAAGIIIAARDTNGEVVLILSQRSLTDSYPGGTQVTSHGKTSLAEAKLPPEVRYLRTMLRELSEELGSALAALISGQAHKIYIIKEVMADSERIVTFGFDTGLPAEQVLTLAQPGDEVGRLIVVSRETLIREFKPGERETGVPADELAMFSDGLAAVRDAFELFARPDRQFAVI